MNDNRLNGLKNQIKKEQNDIVSFENGWKQGKKKYKQYLKTKKTNFDYSVTEYLCPNDDAGYEIIFYKDLDNDKHIKRIGYGPESASRTHDWSKVEEIAQ